jgi:hypothetical protein
MIENGESAMISASGISSARVDPTSLTVKT